MIKNNKGITLSLLVSMIIIMSIIAGITITISNSIIKDTKAKSIITNMYIVKGKLEVIYEDYEFSGINLPGTNVDINLLSIYDITSDGLSINETTDNLWYRLNSTDLEEMGVDSGMLSNNSEFIVNYSLGEVIFTDGIENSDNEVKYKLSDIIE